MATKLQIRNDTTENWLAVNPILAIGEIGYETTTNRAKFGDGVSKWSNLPYLKCEVYNDSLLKQKIDEINQNLELKANLDEVYTKQQIEDMLFVTADELYSKNYMEKNEALDKFITRQEVWEQNYGYVPTERTINGKELSEDIVLDYTDVQALPDTTYIPQKMSDLENDEGYTTQLDVIQAIKDTSSFKLLIVSELPEIGETMTLYLLPKEGTDNDVYNEYIWIEESQNFEFLGTTAVDLTGYVKDTDYATTSKAGVIKAYTNNGFGVNYSGQPFSQSVTLASYKGYGGNFFIGKGTLENIKYDFVKDGVVNNNIGLEESDKEKVRNWIGASSEVIQRDSFVDFPADRNAGKIFQYTGETTEDFVNGYFYKSVAGESKYVSADPRNITFDYDLFWSELENAGITLETLRLTERDKTRGGFSIMGTSQSETEYRVSNINGIDIDVLLTKSVQSSQNIIGTRTRWYYTYTTIYEWKQLNVQPSSGNSGGSELPDQTDNTGKFLYTDGENLSWEKALKNNANGEDYIVVGTNAYTSEDEYGSSVTIGAHSGTVNNSVAIGGYAETNVQGGLAIGINAKANNFDATTNEDSNTIAIGTNANSTNAQAIAIGGDAQSNGVKSIAIGPNSTAKGEGAVVIGSNALSNSTQGANVVIGPNSQISGYSINSTAIGVGTRATNYDATAIGRSCNAGAQYSFVAGYSAQTDPVYCDYNIDSGQPVVAVGFGAISRSNDTVAIGRDVYADGPFSIVIGQNSTVNQNNSYGVAIGKEAQVVGSEGIAVGHASNSARHSIALGTRADANQFGTIAIGLNTESSSTNAVAIGNQSYAGGQDSVALGSSAVVADYAGFAVQLGVGTNSEANTLQFKDYKLLYDSGIIPYERLSETTPSNGQVLTYDDNEDALVWSEASGGISEVNWGDITGNINNQTDLNNKFVNINNNIQSLDLDMATNYQNLNKKFDNAIQNLEQDFSTTTRRLEIDIQDTEDKLQSQIDTLSAIGEFLAIWDCDTGSARYLTEGYEYRTGNYFIIGTIAEGEDVVNYMPDGNMYPGKAETSEDVRVSDMWFYNGEHWIYLANHERAVAVDADLNVNSTNPIENQAVTKAFGDLDVKIDNKTDALSNAIEELQNRPIPIAVPQLASVDVEQIKDQIMKEERRPKEEWMGNYSDIIVTTNLDKETLINNMYDLYVTISRFKTNKNLSHTTYNENGDEFEINYRNIQKYSVMNDLRQKTNMRLYCWRFVTDSSYNETDPRRYCYFYTKDNYNDNVDTLWEEDTNIGLWSNYYDSAGIGTCFNAIVWKEHGYYVQMYYNDYFENGSIERYEEGDIDSFANLSNSANYPEYNISNYITKMECRKYTKDGQNYFFWAEKDEWENGGCGYCYGDYLNPIPNGIPEHMDMLSNAFDEVQQIEENGFVFVEKRPDLNYKQVEDFEALLEALQELTFRGKFVDYDGRPTYWNCYWFDYPVMPIMLKDCEVRTYSGSSNWVKLEDLVKEGATDILRDDLPLELKLPYNTYYLWMRFCSLQKRCAYGDYSNWLDEEGRGIDTPMYPHQKHDLKDGVTNYNVLCRRAFARPRQSYRINGEYGKISEYIQFNICYPNTVYSGVKSKSTPITKKLNITTTAISGLRD